MVIGRMFEDTMARLHTISHSRDLARFQRLAGQRARAAVVSLAVRAVFPHHHALRAETLREAPEASSAGAAGIAAGALEQVAR